MQRPHLSAVERSSLLLGSPRNNLRKLLFPKEPSGGFFNESSGFETSCCSPEIPDGTHRSHACARSHRVLPWYFQRALVSAHIPAGEICICQARRTGVGRSSGLRRLPAPRMHICPGRLLPQISFPDPWCPAVVAREGGGWNKQNFGQIKFEGF